MLKTLTWIIYLNIALSFMCQYPQNLFSSFPDKCFIHSSVLPCWVHGLSISTPEVYTLTSGKESEIRSSTPCSFLQPPVTSSLLHANILLLHPVLKYPQFLSILPQ